ncbi:probable Protein MMF1, mitochondrial [Saccharomycodes ludwigii]|uniref:Probable Protein MMF1, mitochondrial n=1 Tax=Saccharomycodes ludwigii TaxID=36035 RepID=A0A376B7F7_9ASCO|nr:hypothetical protein SCDLUD_000208 [Saccharomycodes ludwigii]KAH3902627.1 hypothetical protein SCDLUD_000208 [Saccharomycodes ludwigii]SSD60625.1 probable Protein MMF1, mitochondrial [Saccharomycodes ludwigii]
MVAITTINAEGAPAAAASYSHAVKTATGLIYVSGQVPLTPENKLVEGSISDKAEQVITNIRTVLKASNSDLNKIVKVNIFLADIKSFAEFNSVYAKYFSVHKPARSCVAVAALPLGADLEMEVVAVEND